MRGYMLKRTVFAVCFAFAAVPFFAFDLSAGGRLDFSFSTLTANTSAWPEKSFLSGGGITLMAVLGITEHFAVQPELSFSCRDGMTYAYLDKRGFFSVSSINIPVLAKGRFLAGPGVFGVNAGPVFSFLVGDVRFAGAGTVYRESLSAAKLNVVQFGFAGGVDYMLPLGPGSVVFDIRGTGDFTDMSAVSVEMGHRVQIALSVGYVADF